MDEIEISVEVEVNPTEDEAKVRGALENIFGNLKFEVKSRARGSLIVGSHRGIEGLTKLGNLLRRDRIRDAARGVLLEGMSGKSVVFYLNKQVAYVGHVSFSKSMGESPLGPIKVEIKCENPRDLIDWLAPKTA